MLFAHAGHSHEAATAASSCCSKIALGVALLALAISVAALVIALKKNKKKPASTKNAE